MKEHETYLVGTTLVPSVECKVVRMRHFRCEWAAKAALWVIPIGKRLGYVRFAPIRVGVSVWRVDDMIDNPVIYS